MIANALHDDDLSCRKSSHVEGVDANQIWGISVPCSNTKAWGKGRKEVKRSSPQQRSIGGSWS